jgi:murein endopeptidase
MFAWALLVVFLGGAELSDRAQPDEFGPAGAGVPSARGQIRIRHPRMGNEALSSIAARYHVSEAQLTEWNPGIGERPQKGEIVELLVDGNAPPFQPVFAHIGAKATWEDIATRYDVTVDDLKAANPRHAKRRRPPKGARLTVWVPSGVRRLPAAAPKQPLPKFTVPSGGVAVGRPHRGRLVGGIALPDSDQYTVRLDHQRYGTSLAVAAIQSAIAGFRRETGFDRDIVIGALSRKTGRRLPPHKSHRAGRDADIRLPAFPHAEGFKLQKDEIDWPAAWALVDAFARTGDVQVIFLERKLWQRLRKAAMRTGATDAQLDRAFDLIHHSKGHTAHIHVRFVCSAEATDCVE